MDKNVYPREQHKGKVNKKDNIPNEKVLLIFFVMKTKLKFWMQ